MTSLKLAPLSIAVSLTASLLFGTIAHAHEYYRPEMACTLIGTRQTYSQPAQALTPIDLRFYAVWDETQKLHRWGVRSIRTRDGKDLSTDATIYRALLPAAPKAARLWDPSSHRPYMAYTLAYSRFSPEGYAALLREMSGPASLPQPPALQAFQSVASGAQAWAPSLVFVDMNRPLSDSQDTLPIETFDYAGNYMVGYRHVQLDFDGARFPALDGLAYNLWLSCQTVR